MGKASHGGTAALGVVSARDKPQNAEICLSILLVRLYTIPLLSETIFISFELTPTQHDKGGEFFIIAMANSMKETPQILVRSSGRTQSVSPTRATHHPYDTKTRGHQGQN